MKRFLNWLGFGPEAQAAIRRTSDASLGLVTNEQLIMLGLARLMDCEGCTDRVLIDELYKRGRRLPK